MGMGEKLWVIAKIKTDHKKLVKLNTFSVSRAVACSLLLVGRCGFYWPWQWWRVGEWLFNTGFQTQAGFSLTSRWWKLSPSVEASVKKSYSLVSTILWQCLGREVFILYLDVGRKNTYITHTKHSGGSSTSHWCLRGLLSRMGEM